MQGFNNQVKTPLLDHKFKDLTDVLKGAAASLAGFAGRTGARVFFLFFAGNFYGAVRLGELASVIAVIEILVMLGIFGFRRSLLEFLEGAKNKPGEQYSMVKTALTVTFVIGTTLAVTLALVWDFIGLNMKTPLYPLFAFLIPFVAIMDVILTTTRFKRIIRYEVFARSLVEPWTLALAAITFYFLNIRESGLLLAYSASLIAAFLFALFAFHQVFDWKKLRAAEVKFSLVKKMMSFSGPTALVDAIGVAFRRADIIFLSIFSPDLIVGVYYGIQNLATIIQKTRHVFDPILSPVINQTLSQRGTKDVGEQLSQVCRWILTLLALQLAIMAFYSAPLLGLIGEGFAVGATALIIVLFAEALEGTLASAELPFVFKKPILNLVLTATAFGIHLVGLTYLTPRYGMVGAASSFLIALFCLNTLRLIFIKDKFDISLLAWRYLKPIIAGSLAYLALYYAGQYINLTVFYLVPVGIALGVTVYVAAFWAMGASQEDKDFVAYLRGRKKPELAVDKDYDEV